MNPDLSINETEKEIIQEFELFDSWDDKYEYIIDLGKNFRYWMQSSRLMRIVSEVASPRYGWLQIMKMESCFIMLTVMR